MATLWSVSQVILREDRTRWAHLALVLAVLAVMGALLEREVAVGRVLALPLLLLAVWVFVIERGWNRIFPLLVQLFAAVVLAGLVALSPLPA